MDLRSLSGAETDAMVDAYVTAMCWANASGEADDGSDAEDYAAIEESLPTVMRSEMRSHVLGFLDTQLSDTEADSVGLVRESTVEILIAAVTDWRKIPGRTSAVPYDAGRAGHDFALTRNRHGVGYWDRGIGQAGKVLTDIAHSFGESHVWVRDNQALCVE